MRKVVSVRLSLPDLTVFLQTVALCQVYLCVLLLQVAFADREGTSTQTALHHPAHQSGQAQGTTEQTLHPQQSQSQQQEQQQVVLQPQKWSVVYCIWQPRCSGRLTAQSVIAHTGDASAVVWNLDLGMGGISA